MKVCSLLHKENQNKLIQGRQARLPQKIKGPGFDYLCEVLMFHLCLRVFGLGFGYFGGKTEAPRGHTDTGGT